MAISKEAKFEALMLGGLAISWVGLTIHWNGGFKDAVKDVKNVKNALKKEWDRLHGKKDSDTDVEYVEDIEDEADVNMTDDLDYTAYALAINPVKFKSRRAAILASSRATTLIDEKGRCSYHDLVDIQRDLGEIDDESYEDLKSFYEDDRWDDYGWIAIDDILVHETAEGSGIWVISDVEPYKFSE